MEELIDLSYIAKLAIDAAAPKKLNDYQYLIPNEEGTGFKVYYVMRPDEVPLPDHIRQDVSVFTLESFIAYVKDFKTFTARIFGCTNGDGAKITAILD